MTLRNFAMFFFAIANTLMIPKYVVHFSKFRKKNILNHKKIYWTVPKMYGYIIVVIIIALLTNYTVVADNIGSNPVNEYRYFLYTYM